MKTIINIIPVRSHVSVATYETMGFLSHPLIGEKVKLHNSDNEETILVVVKDVVHDYTVFRHEITITVAYV